MYASAGSLSVIQIRTGDTGNEGLSILAIVDVVGQELRAGYVSLGEVSDEDRVSSHHSKPQVELA
jgi:hypothetical protein